MPYDPAAAAHPRGLLEWTHAHAWAALRDRLRTTASPACRSISWQATGVLEAVHSKPGPFQRFATDLAAGARAGRIGIELADFGDAGYQGDDVEANINPHYSCVKWHCGPRWT
jgi:hypothetical protein